MIKQKYKLGEEGKFDGKSSRYQTKRWQEQQEKKISQQKAIEQIETLLKSGDIDVEEKRILELKLKTLKGYIKVQKRERKKEHLIPFTVAGIKPYLVYIREHNLFKPKWVELFGKKLIQKRYDDFLYLLEINANPTYEVGDYWNPF